jgi:hypothetical protein
MDIVSRYNLSVANLSRADLSGANLSWANLSGANLFEPTHIAWNTELDGAWKRSEAEYFRVSRDQWIDRALMAERNERRARRYAKGSTLLAALLAILLVLAGLAIAAQRGL